MLSFTAFIYEEILIALGDKMATTEIQRLRGESRRISDLVTKISARLDGGHYDFMSWKGRTQLKERITEYERYANEPYRVSSIMGVRDAKQSKMETELHSIPDSTY